MPATTESLIRKTPGVMGGEACIRRTRIAVWNLVEAWNSGYTDAELLRRYDPPLSREDLEAARAYYAANRAEVDAALRDNNQDA